MLPPDPRVAEDGVAAGLHTAVDDHPRAFVRVVFAVGERAFEKPERPADDRPVAGIAVGRADHRADHRPDKTGDTDGLVGEVIGSQ